MAAYRYWRIAVYANMSGGSSSLIRELRMFDSRAGSNLCTGGTPVGNGSNLSQAFDGTTVSGGATASSWPHLVGYDFGSGNDKDLTHITLFSSSSDTPRLFYVQGSADGLTWVTTSAVSGTQTSNSTELYFEAQTAQPSPAEDADHQTVTMRAIGDYESLFFSPAQGSIGVAVLDAGVPVWKARVHVHMRRSGLLVARGITDKAGQVIFSQLNQFSFDYYAIAFDPEGGVSYNALIYDKVLPSGPVGAPVITDAPPVCQPDKPYSFQMRASGGVPPYAWGISSGSLPSGITISSSGLISGTATTESSSSITIEVQSHDLATASLSTNFVVEWPSARYWRILFTEYNGGYAGVYEMEYRTTVGGSNAATGGTPAASTVFASPTYSADKAFDGNVSTYWSSLSTANPGGEWLSYDFGTSVVIKQVGIAAPSYYPVGFIIQASNDGASWSDVYSQSGLSSGWSSSLRLFTIV